MLRSSLVLALAAALGVLVGCRTGPRVTETNGDELHARHDDLTGVLSPADLERWVAARVALGAALRQHCADGRCAGLASVASVALTCSASLARHRMHSCAWVIGGSVDAVDAASGAHRGGARAFTCAVSVSSTAHTFVDELVGAADGAFEAPLLGDGRSFRDAVNACAAAQAEAALPAPTTGDWVPIERVLPAEAKERWSRTLAKLPQVFDAACGDTFCEGDFNDISGLGLTCAARRTTGEVATCTWSFALARWEIAADGTVVTTTETRSCPVTITAPATALVAALDVPDPLRAALPGGRRSLYDALGGCL